MSGPKTSRYRLTDEQRRILAEQRERERRKAVATENVRRNHEKIKQFRCKFVAEQRIASELAARVGNDNGLSLLLEEFEKLFAPLETLVSFTDYNDVASVEATDKKMQQCLANADKIAQKIVEVSQKNESELRSNLQGVIDEGFSSSFVDNVAAVSTSPKETAIGLLTQLKQSKILPQKYIDEISNAITCIENIADEAFIQNYVSVTINPLIKKANNFVSEYAECLKEFEPLHAEYVAICKLYYYVPQNFACNRSGIQELKAEIQRIKEEAAHDDEQIYISECLDEVMAEMGYTVLGSREVTKHNGSHFRNELFDYGDGMAVNVTYSADGKIAMELGGLDICDRMPSETETEKLCESMESFCGDFEEIEKRLLAKGVVVADRISLLPPDAEYAQIINSTDFILETSADPIRAEKHKNKSNKKYRKE